MRLHIAALVAMVALMVGALDLSVAKEADQVQARGNNVTHAPAKKGVQGNATRHHGALKRNHSSHKAARKRVVSRELQAELQRWRARLAATRGTGHGTRAPLTLTVNGMGCPNPGTAVYLTDQIVGASGIPGNLHDQITAGDTTYVLAPGAYTWDSVDSGISNYGVDFSDVGDVCIIGDVSAGGTVTITAGDPLGAEPFMFNLLVNMQSAFIGIKDVIADGNSPTYVGWTFVAASSASTATAQLQLENVELAFWSDSTSAPAAFVDTALAFINNCFFYNNEAADHAGAIDFPTTLGGPACGGVIQDSVFWGNIGGSGGAINVHTSCSVDIVDSEFRFNAAPTYLGAGAQGGAIFMDPGAIVNINGTFCAQDNSAGDAGGFAYVSTGATLTFNSPANQTVATNTPDDIYIDTGGIVTAGAGPWTAVPGPFTMLATVLECDANFTSGESVCAACSAASWDATHCACQATPPVIPPDVIIYLAVTPTTTTVGTTLTYNVTLENLGSTDAPAPNGFTLQVPACVSVPGTLVPIASSGSPTATCVVSLPVVAGTPSTLTCTVASVDLLVGESWSYQLPLDAVAPCTAAVAVATLTQPTLDPANGVDSATATITCRAGAKCCNADGSAFKPGTIMCSAPTSGCKGAAYCTGDSQDCPANPNLPDGQACQWVQPDTRRWYRHSTADQAASTVATAAATTASTKSPTITLAFEATDDTHPARKLQAYGEPDGDASGLRPCLGECVAGRCLLVFPFRQPEGGCCRVMTLSEFLHHSHGQRGEQHRYGGHDDDAPYAHDDSEPHEAPSKVCWQQAQGGEGY